MKTELPRSEVVLLGVGHTNAHVLRMWRMDPPRDAHLTCVSNYPVVTYSGMLPGVLAGQYPQERMEIDLVRLCAASGARLIVGEATGLDPSRRRLLFADRPPLAFDVLSVGIGSIPTREGVELDGDAVLPIKPMQTFLTRLERRLRELHERCGDRPLRIAIVGGGAGGVEITFCLPSRVRKLFGERPVEMTLINAHGDVAGGVRRRTQDRVREKLARRGVRLMLPRRVVRVTQDEIVLDNGERIGADLVLWSTSAAAPPLLASLNLPRDDEGFLLTGATLQTTAGLPIFAVGDTGTIAGRELPKAGVYAVRQGPVLWENIRRMLAGRPLAPYEPQRGFMKLLNTGDGRALGDWKGITFEGRWTWSLKDRIDGRFMDKYQDYRPSEMNGAAAPPDNPPAMRCVGCGGKVGGTVLARVLKRLEIPPSEHVLLGLDQPDDAAIVRSPGGRPMTVTTDFFAAPLDDPYLVGRIAALNAASDAFALGAQPLAALAMATVPPGDARRQEEVLFELLAGGLEEFRRMGATLVGGHTIEGPQLTIGYTILADSGERPPRAKANLRVGDQLILTKPLGTGVLLAAHMRAECRAPWMEMLLASMLHSNAPAASLLEEFDIAAVTDITGFGLAGHLREMLDATNRRSAADSSEAVSPNACGFAAELYLNSIPLLPGAAELLSAGVESTLAPANRDAEAELVASIQQRRTPQYAALFDPQTSGGLLLAVPEKHVDSVLAQLEQQSSIPAAVVGGILPRTPTHPLMRAE
ncbi:MAG: selenide, water dikinase SelD [Planctomycetes bacterium]|nr:selenide, water dikinase SelD [Planctomycetota bacterium]